MRTTVELEDGQACQLQQTLLARDHLARGTQVPGYLGGTGAQGGPLPWGQTNGGLVNRSMGILSFINVPVGTRAVPGPGTRYLVLPGTGQVLPGTVTALSL